MSLSIASFLPPSWRPRLIGLLVLGGLTGVGRLAVDEVTLVGEAARVRGLELRASQGERDRRRVIELERSLSASQVRAERLEEGLEEARAQLATSTAAEGRLRSELELAQATEERLRRSGEAASALAAQRAEQIASLSSELEDSTRSLRESRERLAQVEQEARARAEELTLARSQLETQGTELSTAQGELSAARERLAKQTQTLAEQERQLTARATAAAERERELAQLTVSARRMTQTLERLKRAGVNVARLSGERPMPSITAVIVQIDLEAVPPQVMIDAGSSRGLELKDKLYVVRDGREIAQLEVEQAGDEVAATRLVRGARGLKLRLGDTVSSIPPGGLSEK